MKQKQNKNNESDFWIKICLLPLLIGGSLVIANVTMFIFKLIGWILLIFGLSTGAFYLFKFYKTNREKILRILRKVFSVKEGY